MKSSSNMKVMGASGTPKKKSKDREKRKSQADGHKSEQGAEKGSPAKVFYGNSNDLKGGEDGSMWDGNTRKYAGIGPESIVAYANQARLDEPNEPNDLCSGLAEDISYKLRYIIHDAVIKARLAGRSVILPSDIDATFENLSIEKVYGAQSTPNWMSDGTIFTLEDQTVNLIDIAESENSYIQPSHVIAVRKWNPDTKDMGPCLKNYFETICFAVVSSDREVRQTALNDLRTNNHIGPVVEWLYHFGYFLLSKDITYDSLTLSALDLIRALEESSVAPQIVSENQLKLLVRLILQRLLRSVTTIDVLKPICRILAILCVRLPLRELVTMKVAQKMPEVQGKFALPIVMIVNELGKDAIEELLVSELDYFLTRVEINKDRHLNDALLTSYNIIAETTTPKIHNMFYKVYGDSLVPMWKLKTVTQKVEPLETNWLNIKSQLLKSRKKIPIPISQFPSPPDLQFPTPSNIEDAFPEYERCAKTISNWAPFISSPRTDSFTVGKAVALHKINKAYVPGMNQDRCYCHSLGSMIL